MAPTAAWPICTDQPRFCYQVRLRNATYSDSFRKADNGQYLSFHIGESLIGFRSCQSLQPSYPVLQIRSRLPYQQITLTWLSLPPVKMEDTKQYPGTCSSWLKKHQMLLVRVGRSRKGSKRVRNQSWYDVVEICLVSNQRCSSA